MMFCHDWNCNNYVMIMKMRLHTIFVPNYFCSSCVECLAQYSCPGLAGVWCLHSSYGDTDTVWGGGGHQTPSHSVCRGGLRLNKGGMNSARGVWLWGDRNERKMSQVCVLLHSSVPHTTFSFRYRTGCTLVITHCTHKYLSDSKYLGEGGKKAFK